MNCDGVRGLLSAYLDGELSAGELLRVEQHLRRCHWCADEVDALRQTIAHVASLDEVEVPPAFHAQLHQRLVALGPPAQTGRYVPMRSKRPDFRRWAVPAAAAAALVIGVTGLNRFMPPAQVAQPPGQQVSVDLPSGSDPGRHETPTVNEPGTLPEQGSVRPDQSTPIATPAVQPSDVEQPIANPSQEPNTTPTQPTDPAVPVQTPLGPTGQGGGVKVATTFLGDVPEPENLPSQQQPNAKFEAVAADPEGTAEALRSTLETKFGAQINENTSVGIVELQAYMDSDVYGAALAAVSEQLKAAPTEEPVEYGSQLDAEYQRLAALESQREALEARVATETDPESLAAVRLALEQLEKQAAESRDAYQVILEQLDTGVITIVLKPDSAQ